MCVCVCVCVWSVFVYLHWSSKRRETGIVEQSLSFHIHDDYVGDSIVLTGLSVVCLSNGSVIGIHP